MSDVYLYVFICGENNVIFSRTTLGNTINKTIHEGCSHDFSVYNLYMYYTYYRH